MAPPVPWKLPRHKCWNIFGAFGNGDRESAFHDLLEIGQEILPALTAAFRGERDGRVREFLVEVIWQYRQPSAIPFLAEALQDPEAAVWKQALDGPVTLASPAALDALRSARTRQFARTRAADEFHRWLDEAIEQVEAEVQRA